MPHASRKAAASPHCRHSSSTSRSSISRGVRNANRWNSHEATLLGWALTRIGEGAGGRVSSGRHVIGHCRPGWLSWTMNSGLVASGSFWSVALAVERKVRARDAQGRVRSSERIRVAGGGVRL